MTEQRQQRQDPIDFIWIHMFPDIDEIAAIWFVFMFGKLRFPGSECAQIVFVDPHSVKESYQKLLAKKILCIGFGDGPFNEHAEGHGDGDRVSGQCAATLVARALGIFYKPELKRILDYVLKKDNSANTREFELAPLVKAAFRYIAYGELTPEDRESRSQDILQNIFMFFEAVWKQDRAFVDCRPDYEDKSCNKTWLWRPDGQKLRIVSVLSENMEMQKFCRSHNGGFAGVVIQRKKTGNTQVFFDHKQVDVELVTSVCQFLRHANRLASGEKSNPNDPALRADGPVAGFYLEKSKKLLVNGSLTHSLPPTKLSREAVERIVFNTIDAYYDYLVGRAKAQAKARAPKQNQPVTAGK